MAEQFTRDMVFGKKKTTDVQETSTTKDEYTYIEIDKLVDFRKGQPFSMYNETKLENMKESIKISGVIMPIIVRPIEDEKYEIIAGHNRVRCARELGHNTIKADIIECDDDKATLIMLDTNLCQRDEIPPVEKGYAYKMQLETIKKIGVQCEHLKSIDELSEKSKDGRTTIQRLIRLTELIKELQDKVNSSELSILAGVEISHIGIEEQQLINNFISDNKIKISINQAELLRANKGEITEETLQEILQGKVHKEKVIKFTGKIKKDTFKKYKDKFSSDDEFDTLINELLEKHFNN